MANDQERLRRILDSSGVSYTEADLQGKPVAQKTGTTMADAYFNAAGANTGNPVTVGVGADGNAPRGLNVGDTVRTAGGSFQVTDALAPGANYNPTTGYWSRQTTDRYGTPYETSYTSPWRKQIMDALAGYQGQTYGQWKQGDMYAGLRKDYERQGQRAMQDTLGQMAARTGGMASSYAGSVAQQAYGNYMEQLEDAARNLYQTDRADQRDLMNLLMSMEDRDYGQWADAYNRQYQQAQLARDDERYADETAYSRGRDAVEDEWRQKEWDYGVSQDEWERQMAENEVAYQQQQDAWNRQADTLSLINALYKQYGAIPSWAQGVVRAGLAGGAAATNAANAATSAAANGMAAATGDPMADAALMDALTASYPVAGSGGGGGSRRSGGGSRGGGRGGSGGNSGGGSGGGNGGDASGADNAGAGGGTTEGGGAEKPKSGNVATMTYSTIEHNIDVGFRRGESTAELTRRVVGAYQTGKITEAEANALLTKIEKLDKGAR